MWADDKGQASKVIVFPYEYKGSISLDGYGRLYVNSVVAAEPSALRRPYGDERLYVPIRAVAEAAGYDVSWPTVLPRLTGTALPAPASSPTALPIWRPGIWPTC